MSKYIKYKKIKDTSRRFDERMGWSEYEVGFDNEDFAIKWGEEAVWLTKPVARKVMKELVNFLEK